MKETPVPHCSPQRCSQSSDMEATWVSVARETDTEAVLHPDGRIPLSYEKERSWSVLR